ncbi:50S ribosomal protein L13 [Candidatus Woesearchaeota archaeon]|nr:50S ribosomal protein L13 [Candidatus Woesearchaeota archaeon]
MNADHIVIDGKNLILGRLCSYVAKKALLGYTVDVVNVEQVMLTGNRMHILSEYRRHNEMGGPLQGPYIKKSSKDLFKRSLKRMLPHKNTRGREALTRVKAYKGLPARFADTKIETLQIADISKVPNTKYLSLAEVTKFLGAK